jgi:hypothetical protein
LSLEANVFVSSAAALAKTASSRRGLKAGDRFLPCRTFFDEIAVAGWFAGTLRVFPGCRHLDGDHTLAAFAKTVTFITAAGWRPAFPARKGRPAMLNYDDLVELARLCARNSRIAMSRDVADELWRMAKEYQEQAAKLGTPPEIDSKPVLVQSTR